ncbi:MAG: hypothetical protein N0A24_03570 [Armatimonadetes bacterium]|nr:hypothetical protein [Armatimonadota bacterium]MDW8153290.1 hypothetical protein [Armatimonadota bacterium]
MVRWPAFLLALLLNGFLASQMLLSGGEGSGGEARAQTLVFREDTVQERVVRPGERTVLEVHTQGLVEVVIYEHTGDANELAQFRSGQIPRTARVFTHMKALRYPLASDSGSTFYVRLRHLQPGETVLRYEPGTVEESMARLRRGQNLVRNQGTVQIRGTRLLLPVYQLVPGTILRVEVRAGKGTVGVLRTRDYLEVRDGRASLESRCRPESCLVTSSDRTALELHLTDYEDRYLVAEGQDLVFSYQVIATPEVLNYIATCT